MDAAAWDVEGSWSVIGGSGRNPISSYNDVNQNTVRYPK